MKSNKPKSIVAYGSSPDWLRANKCQFVWHADCHAAMSKQRGGFMLSIDISFHSIDGPAICEHCKNLI